jgi:endonuclease III
MSTDRSPRPAGSQGPAPVREVETRLRAYGTPRLGNKVDPLDELIFIVLSAQTEEYTYVKTFTALQEKYPGWRGLTEAPLEEVEATIRAGGLYRKKAKQLQEALKKIVADVGWPTLEFLRVQDDETVYRYLISIPGVSHKTAKCIMMYSLGREVFPVDTHVWRVARRLGWCPDAAKPSDKQEQRLEEVVPADLRYSLHVNLLAHGRATCQTYWPRCGACILADLCPSRGKPDATWGRWRRPAGVWAKALTEPVQDQGSLERS